MNWEPNFWGFMVVIATVSWWSVRAFPWRKAWRWFQDRVVEEVRRELHQHVHLRSRHLSKTAVESIVEKKVREEETP